MESGEGISGTTGAGLREDLRQAILETADWVDYPAMLVIEADELEAMGDPLLSRYRGPDQDRWTPLWGGLTDVQARMLRRLVTEAADRALARCGAIIVDEIVGAGLRFADEHPHAPCWPAPAAA